MHSDDRFAQGHPRRGALEPQIVVIIPVYGHPVLLSEAIESVLAQVCRIEIGVVVISDGCQMSETEVVASAYAATYPSIVYLRKPNGGPGSARNYGINFALTSWPRMKAVYFLDSDNRLTPSALGDAWQVMTDTPGVGWVYPNIDSFGINWSANYGIPYSPLLHITYDNICDTGSLVARAVLEAGVRFDEDARSGFEDWDFWLQCLDRGFVGKHASFGFTYRQRPESRYQEMSRRRGATIEHLRRRHWRIATPANLLRWEHKTNPRTLLTVGAGDVHFAFTDPSDPGPQLDPHGVVEQFYAARHQPDEILLWPFFAFGSEDCLEILARMKLIHTVFSLMEREVKRTSCFVAVTLMHKDNEIALDIGLPTNLTTMYRRALIWMCQGSQMQEIIGQSKISWAESLATIRPEPDIIEICVSAPWHTVRTGMHTSAIVAMLGFIDRLSISPFRDVPVRRWNWRPKHFPAREKYYEHICKYIGVNALMPRLASSELEVGLVMPIASFGGAEKVTYALARYLRDRGAKLHLFILGNARMTLLSEFDDVFDTVNFLADPEFPIWGGPMTVMGQECFPADSPEVKTHDLVGMLVNLDLVINCHSSLMNSVVGVLRGQQKTKTATYLHVFDSSPLQRPVGHPYLAIAFEHGYDLVLTCSRKLADQIHALGVPLDKIISISNASGFRISDERRIEQRNLRAQPRGDRRLRLLYVGRFDPQKGVERLLIVGRRAVERGLPVDIRVIGSGLIQKGGDNWGNALHAFGISVEPPVYDSVRLADAYAWADALLLPSRWEGAPLVIAECHQLGCIPIATRVGAVDELTTHEVDGFLVENGRDEETAEKMVDMVARLLADDEMRVAMAVAGIARAEQNRWEQNFAPLGEWIDRIFQDKLEQFTVRSGNRVS